MLSLDSPDWRALRHAYGTAGDIPDLLKQLEALPSSENDAEPWFTLWSALAHQGDVYPASFAAVPHVVEALTRDPLCADHSYFQFPAWVEICRSKTQLEVPGNLAGPYFDALGRLPGLVAAAADRPWSSGFMACLLAAIASAKGHPEIAEAVLEIQSSEVASEFLEWKFSR